MVADRQSRVTFLAADLLSAAQPSPTSSPKTRVGGFRRRPSGRLSRRARSRSMFTPGSRTCAYKTASGLGKWPNRDPKGELGFILLKDGWIKRYRSSSNHNYCPSCKNYANTNANMNIGDGNTFAFVNNDPLDNMDYLGLLSPSEALEAAWEAAKAGADYVGEEASLLEIFGGCGGLGVALAYAETQEQDCMGAAIMGPPSQDAAA